MRNSVRTPANRPVVTRPVWTVFLDRDGVFNPDPAVTLRRPAAYRFLPGVKEAFARLNRPEIRTCLVTNQPFTVLGANWHGLQRVHAHLKHELHLAGGRLDRIEASWAPPFVPHRRRKPRHGMLQDGGRVLGSDPARSFMVGDKVKDAEAGVRYGARPVLLATSRSRARLERALARKGIQAPVVADLAEAVEWILAAVRNG